MRCAALRVGEPCQVMAERGYALGEEEPEGLVEEIAAVVHTILKVG